MRSTFEKLLKDKSHVVVASAFDNLKDKDPEKGAKAALELEADSSSEVLAKLSTYYSNNDSADFIHVYKRAYLFVDRWEKFSILEDLGKYAGNHYNLKTIKSAVDLITKDAMGSSFDYYKRSVKKFYQIHKLNLEPLLQVLARTKIVGSK